MASVRPVPDEFLCTSTYERMKDPFMTPRGHSYEGKFVKEWVQLHHTSPSTTEPLSLENIVSNKALKSLIENYEQYMIEHTRELDVAIVQAAKQKARAIKWRHAFKTLRANVKTEVESMQAAQADEVTRLQATHADDVARLQAAHAKEVAILNKEIGCLKTNQRRIQKASKAELAKLRTSHADIMDILLRLSLQPLVAQEVKSEVKKHDARVPPPVPPHPIAISRQSKAALVLFGRESKPGIHVLAPSKKQGRSPA